MQWCDAYLHGLIQSQGFQTFCLLSAWLSPANLLGLSPLKESVELISFYSLILHNIHAFSAGAVYGSCLHSFVSQLDFIQTVFKAALMKSHTEKNVEDI